MKLFKSVLAVIVFGVLLGDVVMRVTEPEPLSASNIMVAEAQVGDSVRFIAQWTNPTGAFDSIAVRWSLSGNNNIRRTLLPPFPATTTDTVLFAALGTPGGGTAGGDISVATWRAGAFSAVLKGYNVTLPDTGPPPPISGLVLLDSATVTNP